jgi:hypothetical protein
VRSSESHEAIVCAMPIDEDKAGLEVICECGLILLTEEEDEFIPLADISIAAGNHREAMT